MDFDDFWDVDELFESDDESSAYIFDYHPYQGGHNPNFDDTSGYLLDLKENKDAVISRFAGDVETWLRNEFGGEEVAIAIVPSHTAGNHGQGLIRLVQHLAQNYPVRLNILKALVRTSTIAKLSTGGNRSIQQHLDSIEIQVPIDDDVPIVVLDDIQTTGNSIRACRQLLENVCDADVYTLAIGQTVLEN